MKRIAILLLLSLLAACKPGANGLNGYVEGEYVYVAPTSGGTLKTLSVERGQEVKAGDALFALDTTNLEAALASAKTQVTQAQAKWNDLAKGQRPEELAVIFKQRDQAEATLRDAEKEYARVKALVPAGGASKADLDQRKAALDTAQAQVAQVTAQLKVATLGAREDQLAEAQSAIDTAQQQVVQAEKTLKDAAPVAPAAGRIEDTYYRPGEFVAAGQPVVSLLPPENVKIRFFVPENMVSRLRLEQGINLHCDGCGAPIPAKITFIASQAEYTPPVIYSVESRQKLVFMIEARPDQFDARLRPGLPVDIDLAAP